MTESGRDTHFGYKTVDLDAKQGMVDDVFRSVARRYDLMNDLMSGGLHRAWKDALVTAINPPRSERAFRLIDVAGGTGDVAFRVADAGGAETHVTVCDINPDMLAVGRARARRARGVRRGQCRDPPVSGQELRRLCDRVRHPQCAAHRGGARGSLSG